MVPQTVVRVCHAMSPSSVTSSVGVPIRSVTMAKKRESTSESDSRLRSYWASGRWPSYSQVTVTPVAVRVSSARRVPSQVKRVSSTTVEPSSARRYLAVRRPSGSWR